MQTTVSQYNAGVLPGTLGPNQETAIIVTVTAAEVIPFGVMVEINGSGQAVLPKSASLGTLGGVALRQTMRMGGQYAPGGSSAYQIGDELPVLRRGQCYAAVDGGGTQAQYGAANVDHSTTTATNRGKFTASATSATTGSEIGAAPAVFYTAAANANGAALVSISLP